MATEIFKKGFAPLFDKTERWLVTGGAGFIGSHLVEALLEMNQNVVVLDNLSTGSLDNLDFKIRKGLEFVQGDIRDTKLCNELVASCDFVLHQAARGSVTKSFEDPRETIDINVLGTTNVFSACQKSHRLKKIVFASSSSVYGDCQDDFKMEHRVGQPLSPYAVSKSSVEQMARVFFKSHKLPIIGLRYFNVFGPRQNPSGPYAAVIPKWVSAIITGRPVSINGDGKTSRDFTYVGNVVYGNLLAASCANSHAVGKVFNLACESEASLLQLLEIICDQYRTLTSKSSTSKIDWESPRMGDIRRSLADCSQVAHYLGYRVLFSLQEGINKTLRWHLDKQAPLNQTLPLTI